MTQKCSLSPRRHKFIFIQENTRPSNFRSRLFRVKVVGVCTSLGHFFLSPVATASTIYKINSGLATRAHHFLF